MVKKILFTILAALVTMGTVALAGVVYEVVCKNKDCQFRDMVSYGGGKITGVITGFCVHCGKFVSLSWLKRGPKKNKAPEPFCRIWNSDTGKTEALYECPHCGKPFLPIKSDKLKYCPKCGQNSLKHELEIMYD